MDKHYQKLRELILKNKENMTGAFKFTVDKYLSSNKKEDVKEYIDTVISQTSDSKKSAEGIWGKEVVDYIVANDLLEKPSGLKLMDILKEIVKEAQRTKKGKKVPAKYLKGLSDKGDYGSKEAMKKEIDKFSGKDEYKKDWKADYKNGKRIKTKKSAATKAFEKKFGKTNEESLDENSDKGIANKAKKSGIPASILRQVYNRGKAAWNSGHRPGVAQDQWAMGRVNSFITGSGGARKADKDLWAKVKKSKKKNP